LNLKSHDPAEGDHQTPLTALSFREPEHLSRKKRGVALAEVPESTTLSEVVAGLNALGVSPRDMIDILKSLKAAGALHAEFVVR
jgi:flagellar basal body P-ring protein FlgI